MRENKFPWLDWIRFIAAFIIVLAHSRHLIFAQYSELEQSNAGTALFYIITKLGNEAVLVFFVISGFLVGGIAWQRIKSNTFDLQKYAIDRFTRIMVPLVPAIILTVLVDTYLSTSINWVNIFGNLFSLQGILVPHLPGNEALWTLSYEVWFYILAAAAGLFCKNKAPGTILLLIVISVFTRLMPHYLVCWLIGAVAYLYLPKKSYKLLFLGIALLIYGCIGRQVGRGSESIDISFLRAFVPSEEMARIIFSIGFALVLQQIILVKRFSYFENIGSKLAAFSYTLYLVHFPIIHLYTAKGLHITVFDTNSMLLFGTVILSCFVVAGIMYFLFEKRTKDIKKLLLR